MSKAEKIFFGLNVLIWIPYGLYLIVDPTMLASLGVFPQTDWVQKVEVRSMYGGAQFAIGLFALAVFLKPQYKEAALLFYTLLFGGLAIVRLVALLIDGPGLAFDPTSAGDPAHYNSGALWCFEIPMLIFAAVLLSKSGKESA